MEKNYEQTNSQGGISIREILAILRKNLILILAVVFVFTALGVGYSFLKEPSYTVKQKLVFTCTNTGSYQSGGVYRPGDTTQNNINTMIAYGETIIDLFDTGVVVDRANYHFKEYDNDKTTGIVTSVKEYLTNTNYVPDDYVVPTEQKESFIQTNNIGVSSLSEEGLSAFAFIVSYTDNDKTEAQDKLDILIHSFKEECKEESNGSIKYFGQFEVSISDMGSEGVVSNVSKLKTIILFFAIGVVAAAIAVCVVTLLDTTVKSREELERIVGAPMFATIANE